MWPRSSEKLEFLRREKSFQCWRVVGQMHSEAQRYRNPQDQTNCFFEDAICCRFTHCTNSTPILFPIIEAKNVRRVATPIVAGQWASCKIRMHASEGIEVRCLGFLRCCNSYQCCACPGHHCHLLCVTLINSFAGGLWKLRMCNFLP
jgi:hypothetical protein